MGGVFDGACRPPGANPGSVTAQSIPVKGPVMAKPIIGANHRATRIDIVLPVAADGDYAFDEDGKPVKGKEPVTLRVPRFDCIPRPQFKELNQQLAALDDMKGDDGEPLSPQDKSFEVVLVMLRPFITDDELKLVEQLNLFELEQIANLIQQRSTISVGELLASTDS